MLPQSSVAGGFTPSQTLTPFISTVYTPPLTVYKLYDIVFDGLETAVLYPTLYPLVYPALLPLL